MKYLKLFVFYAKEVLNINYYVIFILFSKDTYYINNLLTDKTFYKVK